ILKRQRSANDERIMELWDLVPPAQERAKQVQAKLDEAKHRLNERKKAALQERKNIEQEFNRLNALRPEAAKGISPTLLARYEDIKKKHGGIGMAQVNRQSVTCDGCGTHLPERTIAALKDDRVMTCETCHRLLYYTEGLV
ncbi:MAG TPA: C4-type zinc ribbon domain-containing protein, partial [Fimbriimonas sp.]